MLRSRANSKHMPNPPISVTGMRTGFGQCSAAKITLESSAAATGRSHGGKESIHQVGINRNLLQKTKGKVAHEAAMVDQMFWQVMKCSQPQSR